MEVAMRVWVADPEVVIESVGRKNDREPWDVMLTMENMGTAKVELVRLGSKVELRVADEGMVYYISLEGVIEMLVKILEGEDGGLAEEVDDGT
jgi:hypothetical protein